MATPSVSIIIPCYRGAPMIQRALESIARSASGWAKHTKSIDIEVIVIFDGADPAAEAIVSAFKPSYPVTIRTRTKEHSGIAGTRNAGIQEATHALITFLDCDDELAPGRIEIIAEAKDHFVISQQTVVFDRPSDRPIGITRSADASTPSPNFTSVVGSAGLFRELGGFNPELTLGSDLDLVLRARASGITVEFDNRVGTIRHVTGENASLDTRQARTDYFHVLATFRDRSAS